MSRRPVVHVDLPYAQHGFDFFASVRARVTAGAVEAFLDRARTDASVARERGHAGDL